MLTIPSRLSSLLSNEQKRAITRMEETESHVFICWHAMGTGKTRLALIAFELSDFSDLIVITRRIAFSSWIEECELCGLDFLIYADGYTPKNIKRLASTKKRMLLMSVGDLHNMPENFPKGEMIVVDELYLFSNPQAKRSKALQRISLFCSARIGLSGTIMSANDNMTVFGQLRALNGHQVLARNATEFRSKYQTRLQGGFTRYLNLPGSDKIIADKLAPYVDLNYPESRPTVKQVISLEKTPQQIAAIKELQEFYEYREHTFDFAIQIVNAINGISNGWWMESTGNLSYHKTQKLEKLLALLDELVAANERVVVWCHYHNDIARISSELKHPFLKFTGQSKFDEKKWREGSSFIVLATEANGASVNYFKNVKYGIYYSINWKALDLQQSMTRHERKGSTHDGAHYYFLQTKGTNDAKIYNMVNHSTETEKDLILELAYGNEITT